MNASLPCGSWDDDDDEGEHGFEPYGFPRPPEGFFESEGSGRYPHAPTKATCPKCGSKLTRALQWGRKFGCILGAVAGVAQRSSGLHRRTTTACAFSEMGQFDFFCRDRWHFRWYRWLQKRCVAG